MGVHAYKLDTGHSFQRLELLLLFRHVFETEQQEVLSVAADFPWGAADSAGPAHHSALLHTVLQLQPGSCPVAILVRVPGEEKLTAIIIISA